MASQLLTGIAGARKLAGLATLDSESELSGLFGKSCAVHERHFIRIAH